MQRSCLLDMSTDHLPRALLAICCGLLHRGAHRVLFQWHSATARRVQMVRGDGVLRSARPRAGADADVIRCAGAGSGLAGPYSDLAKAPRRPRAGLPAAEGGRRAGPCRSTDVQQRSRPRPSEPALGIPALGMRSRPEHRCGAFGMVSFAPASAPRQNGARRCCSVILSCRAPPPPTEHECPHYDHTRCCASNRRPHAAPTVPRGERSCVICVIGCQWR